MLDDGCARMLVSISVREGGLRVIASLGHDDGYIIARRAATRRCRRDGPQGHRVREVEKADPSLHVSEYVRKAGTVPG